VTLLERLASDLTRWGLPSHVEDRCLVAGGHRFSPHESATLVRAIYSHPAPQVPQERLQFKAFDLLDPLVAWWNEHQSDLSTEQNRLLEQLVAGAINPVEARGWAAVNGWTELAGVLRGLADRWLEGGERESLS